MNKLKCQFYTFFVASCIIMLVPLTGFSQNELREVNTADSLRFEIKIKKAADSLRKVLEVSDKYLTDEDKKLQMQFELDTFHIEMRCQLYLEQDYSDFGMRIATYNLEADYDKLLNKYYKILLSRLKNADKETLKIAQRNWVKYRESEKNLNFLLSEDKYSGGGTIQRLFVASRNMDLTKQRVLDIFEYLQRVSMIEE